MIHAELDGNRIRVQSDDEDAPIVAALPSATRTAKMPPLTWCMPLNTESISLLRSLHTRACPALIAEAERLLAMQRYVEAQKQPGRAEPLRSIPVKEGTQLYNHQIKAYNIALALFGYASAEGGDAQ